jgi:hypothetical protein
MVGMGVVVGPGVSVGRISVATVVARSTAVIIADGLDVKTGFWVKPGPGFVRIWVGSAVENKPIGVAGLQAARLMIIARPRYRKIMGFISSKFPSHSSMRLSRLNDLPSTA